MKQRNDGTEFQISFQGRAGNREFAPPGEEVADIPFGIGPRLVVTVATALIVFSLISAICSTAFTI